MVTLTKGTIEFLPIKVTDVLENLTTLDGLGVSHDLFKADEAETMIYQGQSTMNDGMIALPLIDTTPVTITEGDYNCFIKFNNAPEIPRLGPFRFRVDD
jgi:hypothetical protein